MKDSFILFMQITNFKVQGLHIAAYIYIVWSLGDRCLVGNHIFLFHYRWNVLLYNGFFCDLRKLIPKCFSIFWKWIIFNYTCNRLWPFWGINFNKFQPKTTQDFTQVEVVHLLIGNCLRIIFLFSEIGTYSRQYKRKVETKTMLHLQNNE